MGKTRPSDVCCGLNHERLLLPHRLNVSLALYYPDTLYEYSHGHICFSKLYRSRFGIVEARSFCGNVAAT